MSLSYALYSNSNSRLTDSWKPLIVIAKTGTPGNWKLYYEKNKCWSKNFQSKRIYTNSFTIAITDIYFHSCTIAIETATYHRQIDYANLGLG